MAILGMIDDVGDLVGEQARVDGVTDRAHAGDAVVQLEVAMVVPRERGDALAGPDAESVLQGAGQLLRALAERGIGGPVHRRIRRARHHLDRAVALGRMVDDRRDQKRPVHDQTAHVRLRTRQPAVRRCPWRCSAARLHARPLQRRFGSGNQQVRAGPAASKGSQRAIASARPRRCPWIVSARSASCPQNRPSCLAALGPDSDRLAQRRRQAPRSGTWLWRVGLAERRCRPTLPDGWAHFPAAELLWKRSGPSGGKAMSLQSEADAVLHGAVANGDVPGRGGGGDRPGRHDL